jgi:hypothetical protein
MLSKISNLSRKLNSSDTSNVKVKNSRSLAYKTFSLDCLTDQIVES